MQVSVGLEAKCTSLFASKHSRFITTALLTLRLTPSPQVCRTNLLASALKTLASNKDAPLPLKLFEVSDVIVLDSSRETGARNERRIVAVYSNKEAGFEVIHGLLNRIMEVLGIPHTTEDTKLQERFGGSYEWAPANLPTYFPGR